MAKLPKPPKSFPIKSTIPTKRAAPLPRRIPHAQSAAEPSLRAPDNQTPEQAAKRVWAARPRLSDLQRLSDEELRSAQHQAKLRRWRQWPMFGIGLIAFGMGTYATMLWTSLTQDADLKDLPADLSDRFDKEAEGYDEKVDTSEMLLFLTSKRKKLTAMAKGHVLEVAVGTGRNIPYYKTKQCATVTLLDSSGPMLGVAKRKWNDTHKEYFSRVFFKQQSGIDPITPPYGAQDGYDTVLQTMGLCSTPEPVKLLQNLEASTNENGQILLLEHGKSHYEWLNNMLDKTAPAHADEHGCWWNKDIGKIVEESGLEVVDIKRYNFGTTWWLQLKPRKGMRQRLSETVLNAQAPAAQAGPLVPQKPFWWLWS
ncbi:S-adenosyl-L-methionine-dependent methyltransferase [Stemphylium lycopersici]|uniref:S-adenosyl-L-methionine-dependent methyltransferase n=1 Tax=Stemphylium lycopersici TaxID=183478 RepID=A0A364NCS2_STELY|nr:ubiquinone menaquinone biosynthesis-related protein [Stemphylium lycopersici]RAR07951.1 S-adenosyl-L-methionine-dependent methyltransferase [Stemphylium lycopersici]RAR15056.1 S-adenosyl-L-methionine-dependent methyltransferase [Stemphylium lycopersici]